MVAGPDGYPEVIADGTNVVRMRPLQQEPQHAGLVSRRADQPNALDLAYPFGSIVQQLPLPSPDRVQAYRSDIVQRGTQPHNLGDHRRPRLELGRQGSPCRMLYAYRRDHVTAALVRRHPFQERFPAVEHPDPGWSKSLVAGEGEEVAVQILNVHP